MLFTQRIKVTSGARKGGPFTFPNRMDMHGMKPLREPFDVDGNQHTIAALTEHSAANFFPRAVLKIGASLSLRGGVRRVDQQK